MNIVAVGIEMKKVMIFIMEQEITSLNKHIIGKQLVAVKIRQVRMKVRQVNNENQSISATEQLQHFL